MEPQTYDVDYFNAPEQSIVRYEIAKIGIDLLLEHYHVLETLNILPSREDWRATYKDEQAALEMWQATLPESALRLHVFFNACCTPKETKWICSVIKQDYTRTATKANKDRLLLDLISWVQYNPTNLLTEPYPSGMYDLLNFDLRYDQFKCNRDLHHLVVKCVRKVCHYISPVYRASMLMQDFMNFRVTKDTPGVMGTVMYCVMEDNYRGPFAWLNNREQSLQLWESVHTQMHSLHIPLTEMLYLLYLTEYHYSDQNDTGKYVSPHLVDREVQELYNSVGPALRDSILTQWCRIVKHLYPYLPSTREMVCYMETLMGCPRQVSDCPYRYLFTTIAPTIGTVS